MSKNRNAALDFKVGKVSIKNGRVYGLDCNVDSNSSYNGEQNLTIVSHIDNNGIFDFAKK